jgi:hypothetical protein
MPLKLKWRRSAPERAEFVDSPQPADERRAPTLILSPPSGPIASRKPVQPKGFTPIDRLTKIGFPIYKVLHPMNRSFN